MAANVFGEKKRKLKQLNVNKCFQFKIERMKQGHAENMTIAVLKQLRLNYKGIRFAPRPKLGTCTNIQYSSW